MIQPKELYRRLDTLLAGIDEGTAKNDYLFSVLAKLESAFARDLHITNGRLYVEEHGQFLLLNPDGGGESLSSYSEGTTALDPEAVELTIRNGSYIFNDLSLRINRQSGSPREPLLPAAFYLQSPSRRWIFIFALSSGWMREEVEFCLNAVRAQLNFRLHAEAMKNDMQQAALIQQSLLPSSPPHIAGYETAGRSQPAEAVGGDFFDFSVFGEDVFSVAMGDASGHGLPAALLVRDVVTGLRMGVEKEMKMAEAMQKLNRVIHRSTLSARFVSLFYAEIELNGNIYYVNAGHPPPLLVHGRHVRPLKATGMILGAVPEITLQRASTSFAPGAVLIMFSDGILERRNRANEEFGICRLEEFLVRHQHRRAHEILELLYQTVFAFGDQAMWQDDVTAVVVKKLEE